MEEDRRIPFVTMTLVAVNVIVFLICLFTGNLLYSAGGVNVTKVFIGKEYGRLIWALFLHDGTDHLFNNMIILLFMGAMLERETGHISYAMIYFLSGIGGNVVSLLDKVMTGSNVYSVGASGAVFGLDGLLLALGLFSRDFRKTMPPGRVMMVILLSLYNGFAGDNIDNAAHVGGLLIGFVLSTVYILAKNIWHKKYG